MDSLPTHPHVAVCPSAGIGHLTPFLRLASMLAAPSNCCRVTMIIIRPTLSSAEDNQISTFLSSYPHISPSEFHALPPEPSDPNTQDPFLLQYDAVSRSAHLLVHHLSNLSPPLSVVFSDLMLASGINTPLADLGVLNYTVITTSARFFSLIASLPHIRITKGESVAIPGVDPIQGDHVPPPMCNPDHVFTRILEINCRYLHKAKGVLLNSFDFFEPETISALQSGKVLPNLPPIFPVGPLTSFETKKGSTSISWLDNQPLSSVVFVSDASPKSMRKAHALVLILIFLTAIIRSIWLISWTLICLSKSSHSEPTEKVVKHLIWTRFRPNSSVALHGMLIKGPTSCCLKLDVLSFFQWCFYLLNLDVGLKVT